MPKFRDDDYRTKQIFSTGQVAKLIGVAPRTVSIWFDAGRLRGYRIPGSGDRRIPREHLEKFLAAHEMPSIADCIARMERDDSEQPSAIPAG